MCPNSVQLREWKQFKRLIPSQLNIYSFSESLQNMIKHISNCFHFGGTCFVKIGKNLIHEFHTIPISDFINTYKQVLTRTQNRRGVIQRIVRETIATDQQKTTHSRHRKTNNIIILQPRKPLQKKKHKEQTRVERSHQEGVRYKSI